MDRPYFIGSFQLPPGWLTGTTAVDRHLKAKNKKCIVDLMKNYCITVSMQKISSIHKLIQQILGSHELNDHAHFWAGPPKNHWNNFLLSWICTTMQKISSFHPFFLEIQPILESRDQTGHSHFWPRQSKTFFDQLLIYVNLYQHAKKSGYFTDLFWRYGWLKNIAIWLADNILTHIWRTKISPNMESVQERSK